MTVLYPVLQSIRAEQRDGAEKQTFWLHYWVIFGACHIVEIFFSFLLYMIPAYQTLRFLFFVALIVPETKVCSIVYTFVLAIMEQFQSQISAVENSINETKDEMVKKAKKKVY